MDETELGPAKAVAKTLNLLQVLSENPEIGITELAAQSSMNKSTVYRYLSTMCELGFARQDDNDRYSLTLRLFELGSRIVQSTAIWKHARELMDELALRTRETIHLALLEDLRMIQIHRAESPESLRVSAMPRVGLSEPFHCTALGKVILTYADQVTKEAILKGNPLTRFTDRTITTEAELESELEQIRLTGVGYDNEEYLLGVRCVAVPILRSSSPKLLAALSVSAPAVRVTPEKLSSYAELLKNASRQIAESLGVS